MRLSRVVSNDQTRPRTLILEPWADEIVLAPNQTVTVEADGPETGADLSVEEIDDLIVVSAWDGSDLRLLSEDGGILSDWTGLRVPYFGPPPHPIPVLTHDDLNSWLAGSSLPGVSLRVNEVVSILEGPHAGKRGWVISPQVSDSEVAYLVELEDGRDVLMIRKSLSRENA